MAKKEKKFLSIKSIILIVVVTAVMLFTIYFVPFALADANSTGWFETGRYAHANLYPQLAIQSYTEALNRFPDPRAYPQGTSVEKAKNLLFSLKEGLSGIPFRSIYENLIKQDFKGLRKLVKSGALSMDKLEVDRLNAIEKGILAIDLKKARDYINKIIFFHDEQGRPRYSGRFDFITVERLKQQMIENYNRFNKLFAESDIFIKEDFSRLDALFAEDIKLIGTLSDANLSAVKTALRSRLKSMPMYVKQLLNRNHIEFVKKVDVLVNGLKNKTELLKKTLAEYIHDNIWNKEFVKLKVSGGADKLSTADLQAMYDKFKTVITQARKLVGQIVTDSKGLEAHLKSQGRKGVTLTQYAAYVTLLSSANFKVPSFNEFSRQAKIYADKMDQIKTTMEAVKKDRDEAQTKKFTTKDFEKKRWEAKHAAAKARYAALKRQFEEGFFLPMMAEARRVFANVNVAYNSYLERLKKPYSSAAGEVTAFRRIEELCKVPLLDFDTRFQRIQLSLDKRFMELAEDPSTAQNMRDKIDEMFDRIFKQFLGKTMVFIKNYIQQGKFKELDLFLAKSGYFKLLGKEYLQKNSWRLDLIQFGTRDSVKSESILKRVMHFTHFYSDNGVLGDREETVELNRRYLVPTAIRLIEDGGMISKYKDLLKDLKKVPKFSKGGEKKAAK